VSWDGTGYGTDGTIWGGEFLIAEAASFRRVATLRSFRLPGGARAIQEPRRSAVGALYEILGDALFERNDLAPLRAFSRGEAAILRRMLARAVNAPLTTSAGRLFDAVAAISGLRQSNSFEGQAAMELEFAVTETGAGGGYPVSLRVSEAVAGADSLLILDWGPMMLALIDDLKQGSAPGTVAARFHNALVEGIAAVARRIAIERVALSGGCFQNRCLTERTVRRLEADGFRPYWHQRIPPNDGGIALGQIAAALRSQRKGSENVPRSSR
jgi:hydrogenase maturation protein HypF